MKTFLRYARCVLDIFGAAAIYSVLYVGIMCYREGRPQPWMTQPPSDVAVEFAQRIAPAMKENLEAHREDIIARGPNLIARTAVRLGFPAFLAWLPRLLESAVDSILDIWGSMSIKDLAARLVLHNQQKGRVAHWSIRAAAEAGP